MQRYSLTVDKFLDHAAKWFGEREVVEANAGAATKRAGYASIRQRSNRLSGALLELGLKPGQCVGTLAWNTLDHFTVYYAAMGAGLVCHTLNPRLVPEQLAAMIAEADERILAVSSNLLPLWDAIASSCPSVEHVVVLDDVANRTGSKPWMWSVEQLLGHFGREIPWGHFDEDQPAGLCYTSGTTGKPKGVLYTHRSNYLHTLRLLQADAMAITSRDVVLAAVPMFHANGWGLPFAAPAVGATLVLPGRQLDGESLARLMCEQAVTIAIGIQTVWLAVADHLERTGASLPKLERVIIGGSSCPETLVRRMERVLGAKVQTSWGMTELSPLGTIMPPTADDGAGGSGRPLVGLDLKLTDADGRELSHQRAHTGHLRVKGASVVDRYFRADEDSLDQDGYFDTGDLATIDDHGNLTINGRSKDLIKSGGEWINPAEIEAIVGRDPSVSLVAVISTPDDKWGERPLLVVQPSPGEDIDAAELIGSLRGKVADWWIPERVARIGSMPLAGSGKIDKSRLRADFAEGKILADEIAR
jgi:fatty-acyl-CoA synthase